MSRVFRNISICLSTTISCRVSFNISAVNLKSNDDPSARCSSPSNTSDRAENAQTAYLANTPTKPTVALHFPLHEQHTVDSVNEISAENFEHIRRVELRKRSHQEGMNARRRTSDEKLLETLGAYFADVRAYQNFATVEPTQEEPSQMLWMYKIKTESDFKKESELMRVMTPEESQFVETPERSVETNGMLGQTGVVCDILDTNEDGKIKSEELNRPDFQYVEWKNLLDGAVVAKNSDERTSKAKSSIRVLSLKSLMDDALIWDVPWGTDPFIRKLGAEQHSIDHDGLPLKGLVFKNKLSIGADGLSQLDPLAYWQHNRCKKITDPITKATKTVGISCGRDIGKETSDKLYKNASSKAKVPFFDSRKFATLRSRSAAAHFNLRRRLVRKISWLSPLFGSQAVQHLPERASNLVEKFLDYGSTRSWSYCFSFDRPDQGFLSVPTEIVATKTKIADEVERSEWAEFVGILGSLPGADSKSMKFDEDSSSVTVEFDTCKRFKKEVSSGENAVADAISLKLGLKIRTADRDQPDVECTADSTLNQASRGLRNLLHQIYLIDQSSAHNGNGYVTSRRKLRFVYRLNTPCAEEEEEEDENVQKDSYIQDEHSIFWEESNSKKGSIWLEQLTTLDTGFMVRTGELAVRTGTRRNVSTLISLIIRIVRNYFIL